MDVQDFKEQEKQLRTILNEWDVLGVVDDGVLDEYDDLNHWLLSILHKNADKNEIRSYLIEKLDKHYGLSSASYNRNIEQTLDKIVAWYYKK